MTLCTRVGTVALLATTILGGGGCAIGVKHRYHDTVADVAASGSTAVAVATVDQRNYVLTKNKAPSFVGLSRGGYGNPFDVTTESGQPLSTDFTTSICGSLDRRGFHSKALASPPPNAAPTAVVADAGGAPRVVLVNIREWKSDTMQSTSLLYDVTLDVLDGTGKSLAQSRIDGKDDLGGSAWNPPSHARTAVPIAYKAKLERLLNDPGVVKALTP